MTPWDTRVLASARLRILRLLPRPHQDYFFSEARSLCTAYIVSLHIPISERDSEAHELFSEVMAKLLGVAGAGDTHSGGDGEDIPHVLPIDADPKCDGRIAWLLSGVGGRQALTHRHEDIHRRRHGRWREGGYRVDQLGEEHVLDLAIEPDDPLHEQDQQSIWRGVLIAAKSEFRPSEDVSVLLHLMANDVEVQFEFGSGWPVRRMVDALNRLQPNSPWNDDRVENAKRRLTNWITRLKRDRGLDSTVLMDFFARLARKREHSASPSPAMPHQTRTPLHQSSSESRS
jgi:hypothetical protein